ncbi:MAG: cadherin-like domain-containing protein [Nitrospirae bacterium]|nr:cadherin-like domain-containing protein [Nitrospirota bacterium]MBF0540808.1 cadherin-like domain-containing protein [Nitrospirota bacterium]
MIEIIIFCYHYNMVIYKKYLLISLILCLCACSSDKNEGQPVDKNVQSIVTPDMKTKAADDNPAPITDVKKPESETTTANIEINSENILEHKNINNNKLRITQAQLVPDIINGHAVFKVKTTVNDDSNNIELKYQWYINRILVEGNNTDTISNFKSGDNIMVKITPYKGPNEGDLTVLTVTPKNLPPVITKHNNFIQKDNVYTYQVQASDPDGDTLTYKLTKGHDDVTIDEKTGLITWKPKPDFRGTFVISITVSDPQGASALYDLNMGIKEESVKLK